ncbi:MAG: isoprenylcysteine carboxylmethyltransferase family protein [Candidatus Thorarchaeota archaeon]|nr:MAG: isoprenylcysteine carboxylmethyltransferase family protein [Candidatus Thorarchaeota archaeon]
MVLRTVWVMVMGEPEGTSQRDRLIIVIGPNVTFFVTLAISILLVYLLSLPWFLFPGMDVLQIPRLMELILGQILMILCVGLMAWGVASISIDRARGGEIGAEEASLVTTGAYAYSRHPVTIGFLFGAPGFALVFDFVPLIINAIIFAPILIAFLFYEERELLERFGEEYEAYRRLVPFLIPRRRRV